MATNPTNITLDKNLSDTIYLMCVRKGFYSDFGDLMDTLPEGFDPKVVQDMFVGQKIALIHSELSEGLEAYRKDKHDEHLIDRVGLEVELADAVIRILDLAGFLKYDLASAIEEKLIFNESRAYKHGKNF